jgi:dihydroorotate dehydrogenase electron transfer subunit
MRIDEVEVLKNDRLRGDYQLLELSAPPIAPEVKPGQFVHLRVIRRSELVLRRPFSVFKTDNTTLSIIYKAVGKGTQAMTEMQPGDKVSLLGPLGNGFPAPKEAGLPVVVAGGYGMAALYLVARGSGREGIAFVGGRSAEDILCVADFEALGWKVHVTTEDGSLGEKGLVTEALDTWTDARGEAAAPELFACGPLAMLEEVGRRAERNDWTAWLSLDRHMGCGVGACLACVQKIRTEDGGWTWGRVCREGPVFEARQVVWED